MLSRSWIRGFAGALLAAVVCVGARTSVADVGVRETSIFHREFNALDAALAEFQQSIADPNAGRPVARARKAVCCVGTGKGLGVTVLKGDIEGAFQVYAAVGGTTVPADVHEAYDALLVAIELRARLAVAEATERVDAFEAANSKKSVKRQRKGIETALAALDAIVPLRGALLNQGAKRIRGIERALATLRSVKTLPYVAKPPKGCPDRLAPGESAAGPFTVADFEEQDFLNTYFRANWGYAKTGTLPGGEEIVEIRFGYCNSRDEDVVALTFLAPAAAGRHPQGDNRGGFQRGKVGFVSNLTTGSYVEIEEISLAGRFVRGTFLFEALRGTGYGKGSFLIEIDD